MTASGESEILDDVFQVVRQCMAESLAVSPADVRLESRLTDDLGADSLDFVDVIFMIDQKLDIKVQDSEFNFLTRLDFSSPQVMAGSYLTPSVIEKLETWLPALKKLPDKHRVTPRELFSLVTVEAICLVASRRVRARG